MSRASLFVPLGVFVVLAGLLYAGFFLNDPHDLPSALIGKPFPAFDLPALGTAETAAARHDAADLQGRVVLVNVWATWCPTCRAEHDELIRIHRESGVPIVGINYKDDAAKARVWLARYGDPYEYNIVDRDGTLGVDLGVYGAPETFLVDASGIIVYKRVGEVNRHIWDAEIKPRIDALTAKTDGAGDA